MLNDKPNCAILDEYFYSPEMVSLMEQLHNEGGYSKEGKFSPLLKVGLARCFGTMEDKWIISKLFTDNTEFVTLMYRVPPPTEDVDQNVDEHKKLEAFKTLISRWFLEKDMTHVDDSKNIEWYLLKYMGVFQVCSIPKFLLDDFLKDLEGTYAEYIRLDPEYKEVICPACDHNFKVFINECLKVCQNCGVKF